MTEFQFNVLLFIVTVVLAGVSRFVIPAAGNWLKTSKYKIAYFWIEKAVKAAEKKFKEANSGEIKNVYVKKFIATINTKFNLKLTDEQIDVLVESCCQELNNSNILSSGTVLLSETLSTSVAEAIVEKLES